MLQKALEPWKDVFNDISLTVTPYRQNDQGFEVDGLTDTKSSDSFAYRAQNLWGDVAQPMRGVVNAAKGILHILRGLAMVLPPVFIGVCFWYTYVQPKYQDTEAMDYGRSPKFSFWPTVKGEGQKLLRDLVRGPGLLLRGMLQVATTPLTWLARIPLRRAITAGVENPKYTQDYNAGSANGDAKEYGVSDTHAFNRIVADFKGTLAAYDNDGTYIIYNIIVDLLQPLRGLFNIGKGLVALPISLIRLVLLPIELLIRCKILNTPWQAVLFKPLLPSEADGALIWLRDSAGILLRGLLQVATTPLGWLIRMPLRGLITYYSKPHHLVDEERAFNSESKESDFEEHNNTPKVTDSQEEENPDLTWHSTSYTTHPLKMKTAFNDEGSLSDNEEEERNKNSLSHRRDSREDSE